MACGDEFPACGGEFLPFGRSEALDIHLTHRVFMYVSVVLLLALFLTVVRQRRRLAEAANDLTQRAWLTIVVLVAQVLLGAVNVWAGEHAWLIVAHLAVGTLLWIALIAFAFTLTSVPQASAADARRRAGVEAATA
jgi:cytochrome c oxidase assembly protein subunit 15/protoheme IX farnesyltransferase